MSEFKYACPVCGQHIKCDSSQSGKVMDCPTCFQKITVPQAPATADPKFIIAGTKAGAERPMPAPVDKGAQVAPEKHLPILTFFLVTLLCAVAATWFFLRSRNSNQPPPVISPHTPQAQPTEQEHGAIGLGAWNTQVEYTNVVVTKGTQTLFRSDFVSGTPGWQIERGNWVATNGVFKQLAVAMDCRAVTGDPEWSDYTLSLRARKLGGLEGFLIMFNVVNEQNWTWWNIGGWGNTKHAIENCVSGVKSTLGNPVPGKINTGQWYDVRIELNKSRIRCYLDGTMIHDIAYPTPALPRRSVVTPAASDANWTLDLGAAVIPDALAAGRIHGRNFLCERAILEGGTPTMRMPAHSTTQLGLSIYLHANQTAHLAEQAANISSDTTNAPRVRLRWLNKEQKNTTKDFRTGGYALQLQFGELEGNRLPGKIYLCTPDDEKSYVAGTFTAEIRKPKPPK